jgi:hypothetical protein
MKESDDQYGHRATGQWERPGFGRRPPFHTEPSQVPVEKPKKCCHWLIDCRPLSINPSSLFLVEDRYGMIIPKFRRRRK